MYAKKSLGQHFLTSTGALDAILDAGDITADDTVLEIGPGKGVLTERLLEFADKVIAVEKDDQLFELLKEKFSEHIQKGKLILIHQDILEFEMKELGAGNYKLVANIPYNITGHIFRTFLESNHQPERMVLMVQKEVAQRIVAKDEKESILSLSVKAYGTPQYVQTVKAGSFSPAPKVDSAILAVQHISKDFFNDVSEEIFFKALHAGFASKRKKLSSNLGVTFGKEKVLDAFKKLGLDENLRAEDTKLNMWRELGRII